MKYRSALAALTTTLALVTVAACDDGSTDPVAWTDKVCASLLAFTVKASAQPNIDGSNPQAALQSLSDYLGTAIAAADESIAGLSSVGPSPVAGGDEIVDRATTAFTSMRTAFQDARTKLEGVDTSNPAALFAGVGQAVTPLASLPETAQSLQGLQGNAELEAAAKQAPNCQKFQQ